jgi:large subunit ribosomal protein LP0
MSKGVSSKAKRKGEYFDRLKGYLTEYNKVLIVTANNVGSNQLQQIRQALRGDAALLMGKNTMIRKCMREHLSKNPKLEPLLPHVKGNIGFVFTNGDLPEIRNKLAGNRVSAAAKAGSVSPCDVIVPAGSTGLEPTKTSFFQALLIPTKINKAVIEIINDVNLIKAGAKVTASQAVLLQMLNIRPFSYGLEVKMVYDDGSVYPSSLLDLTDADILAKFRKGVTNVASLSLQIGYPTVASAPYALINSFKDVLAVSIASNYSFPAADKIKEILANPEAFAAAAAAAAGPSAGTAVAPTKEAEKPAAAAAAVEDAGEEVMDAGGLFGGDEDDY